MDNSYFIHAELICDGNGPLSIDISEMGNGDSQADCNPRRILSLPDLICNIVNKVNVERSLAISTMKFSRDEKEVRAVRIDQ